MCNKPFIPTREDTVGHTSVIDLTFKNPAANRGNILRTHYVDPNIGALSDHHAIILQVGHSNSIIPNPSTNNLNWKHADEEEFKCTLKELLEDNRLEYHMIVSESLNPEKETAMPDELDRAMEFIQTPLEDTANKAIPEWRISSKSKPWWMPELSKAYKDLQEAHSIMHGWMRDFHTPLILLAEHAEHARKTKNEYYQKKVEEATSQNIWSFQKWTTANRTYMSPPLD